MASLAPRLADVRYHRRRRVVAASAAGGLVALVAALGSGGGPAAGPAHAGSVPAATGGIAATVQSFGNALGGRDFETICNRLFTPAARDAEGGASCPSRLAANASVTLDQPRLRLTTVALHGSTATATIAVQQPHAPESLETLGLQRIGDQWRIASASDAGED